MQYRVLSLASRTGDTEEAIGKDAQSLLWLFLEVYERGKGMGMFLFAVGAGKGYFLHSAILLKRRLPETREPVGRLFFSNHLLGGRFYLLDLGNWTMLDQVRLVNLLVTGKILCNGLFRNILDVILFKKSLIHLEFPEVVAEDQGAFLIEMHHTCLDQANLVSIDIEGIPSLSI